MKKTVSKIICVSIAAMPFSTFPMATNPSRFQTLMSNTKEVATTKAGANSIAGWAIGATIYSIANSQHNALRARANEFESKYKSFSSHLVDNQEAAYDALTHMDGCTKQAKIWQSIELMGTVVALASVVSFSYLLWQKYKKAPAQK